MYPVTILKDNINYFHIQIFFCSILIAYKNKLKKKKKQTLSTVLIKEDQCIKGGICWGKTLLYQGMILILLVFFTCF